MDQQETRLEHYFGDMYDKATLERIEADAAAERERRAAAEAKAAELNLRTPTRRELDAVISACRKTCRDWAIWKIRQVQVTEMDRRARSAQNAVTGYEVERKRTVKERYYKRSK